MLHCFRLCLVDFDVCNMDVLSENTRYQSGKQVSLADGFVLCYICKPYKII